MSSECDRLTAALADRYEIQTELGQGGMATVYLATDLKHERQVAIKVLKPDLAAAIGAERFLAEIKTTANLQHPHIVPLHDSGDADSFLYFVMPYVEGESLRDKLDREKQLPIDEAVRVATEVAEALEYAHGRGVIHRDIKPANILLHEGRVLVADFGIALAARAGDSMRLTETGTSLGTPHYMSPEQAAGESDLDGRTDLYALGCVMYEMLAGEPPFTGPSVQAVIAKHMAYAVASISAVRATVPAALDRVLARALAKTPADRFPMMHDFVDAVTEAVAQGSSAPTDRSAMDRSVAVLPFENLSGDTDDEYFSDGMTEEIINALTQIPELKIIARTSVFAFKGKHEDVRSVAAELGVKRVLEGTVRRAGKRVRVTAQLIKAQDGSHEWSERFDREMEDVFALQDDIAHCIAQRFQVGSTAPESPSRPSRRTPDLEAYEHYLRGRFAWERLDFQEAKAEFEAALGIEPDYALAHVGLAMMYNMANSAGIMAPRDCGPLAQEAAERALAIDDSLAEAHTELAWTAMAYHWDWETAEREILAALALNPRYYNAHRVYAVFLGFIQGRFDEGLAQNAKGLELDPLSPLLLMDRGFLLAAAGRFDDAVDLLQPLVDHRRATVLAQFILAVSYARIGRREEAIRVSASVLDAGRSNPGFGALAYIVKVTIDQDADMKALYREAAGLRDTGYVQPVALAMVAGTTGQMDEAFEWLDQACEEGDGIMWLLKHHPSSDPLRDDPRFDAFLARVGFPLPDSSG